MGRRRYDIYEVVLTKTKTVRVSGENTFDAVRKAEFLAERGGYTIESIENLSSAGHAGQFDETNCPHDWRVDKANRLHCAWCYSSKPMEGTE